jgi:serine protease Do
VRIDRWLALGLLTLGTAALGAQDDGDDPRSATATVFARYASRILKVQVVENGSAAKISTGTAFFVGPDGRMMTNYHVIAEWIHDPEHHRIEVLREGQAPILARVLTVDVIADLAVLATDLTTPDHFALGAVSLRQGDRLYSLGHPGDLGLSIVEGTYNGLLQHTLHPRIHFTGSINPGMSGGPTITRGGGVVGVNVSTMGNQRSFLVPRERAAALLASTRQPGFTPPARFLDLVASQVTAFQDEFLAGMFDGAVPTADIGRFRVATQPKPLFQCWGNADRDPEDPVETLEHSCTTDDYIYIADGQWANVMSLHHEVASATRLGKRRFTAHLQQVFAQDRTMGGSEEHVTRWHCDVRNVAVEPNVMRVSYCVRRYKKLGPLYDAVVRTVSIGNGETGLISTLRLSGVTARNAEWLSTRWLEMNGWR